MQKIIFFLFVLLPLVTSPVVPDIPNCKTTHKYQVGVYIFTACIQCQAPFIYGVDKIPLILPAQNGYTYDHSQGIACQITWTEQINDCALYQLNQNYDGYVCNKCKTPGNIPKNVYGFNLPQCVKEVSNQPKYATQDQFSILLSQLNLLKAKKIPKLKIVRVPAQSLVGDITLSLMNMEYAPFIQAPKGTFGLLIQIHYYSASRNDQSHGYMQAKMNQKGDQINKVQFHSTKFNWYANTANQLQIIPWDQYKYQSALEIKISDTYNTQGNGNTYGKNYYQIRLVGFLVQQ